MGDVMRLDKLLSMLGEGTRSEVRALVRAGRVCVGGRAARDAGMQVDAGRDPVTLDGRALVYKRVRHVMMNKPGGVLTAARDPRQRTVMDLLPPLYAAMGCMPAGRLDKDTEGLLIVTSDGQLAHRIISPKREVGKVYLARVDGLLTEEDVSAFAAGLHIDDGDGVFDARAAELAILSAAREESEALVRVTEGKYHQVKRMFAARGRQVTYLKRMSIGALALDPALAPGQWREMTDEEVALLESEAGLESKSALRN
ncbi:MAG: pseudouridine synthase [Clostridia bacterium]|nr:pseudouridine synthase [Clostridia bacterium]